jgi:hypothetical protein
VFKINFAAKRYLAASVSLEHKINLYLDARRTCVRDPWLCLINSLNVREDPHDGVRNSWMCARNTQIFR